ncbi:MAG: DUF2061 domain-containing protein [Candidatus Altiarchaeota archaeon]
MTKKHIRKAVGYRVYSILIMAIVSYVLTGSIIKMTAMTTIVEAVKAVQYYFFEIVWHRLA